MPCFHFHTFLALAKGYDGCMGEEEEEDEEARNLIAAEAKRAAKMKDASGGCMGNVEEEEARNLIAAEAKGAANAAAKAAMMEGREEVEWKGKDVKGKGEEEANEKKGDVVGGHRASAYA